jgi:hypothetical protein
MLFRRIHLVEITTKIIYKSDNLPFDKTLLCGIKFKKPLTLKDVVVVVFSRFKILERRYWRTTGKQLIA